MHKMSDDYRPWSGIDLVVSHICHDSSEVAGHHFGLLSDTFVYRHAVHISNVLFHCNTLTYDARAFAELFHTGIIHRAQSLDSETDPFDGSAGDLVASLQHLIQDHIPRPKQPEHAYEINTRTRVKAIREDMQKRRIDFG